MKVFLSWSGSTSYRIAERLHKWLPMVIQKIEPYISTEIEKGTRWNSDIAEQLEKCSFGVACVTLENKEAPWLLFEAGALSKSVSEGKLAPVLFGLEQADIQKSPLTQFQMTKFEKGEFYKLLISVNEALEPALDKTILDSLFEALWPQLEREISDILAKAQAPGPTQPVDDSRIMGAMEELLTNSRAISQAISRPEKILPEEYLDHILRMGGRLSSLRAGDVRRIDMLLHRVKSILLDSRDLIPDEVRSSIDKVHSYLDEARFLVRDDIRRVRPGNRIIGRQIAIEEHAEVESQNIKE